MNIKILVHKALELDQKQLYKQADKITERLAQITTQEATQQLIEDFSQSLQDPKLFEPKDTKFSPGISKNVIETGDPKEFLDKLSGPAQSASTQTGGVIPPSVILAIGAWESGWGKSELAKQGNYFGIKSSPTSGGTGSVKRKTFEFDGGKHEEMAEFATFNQDAVSSMAALPIFLQKNPRYRAAIKAGEKYKKTKSIDDLHNIIDSIFDAGYSTDKSEPSNIKNLINQHDLTRYD